MGHPLRALRAPPPPPKDDKLLQVNDGVESNPKPIFTSESMSPSNREDTIQLIREYIDMFSWSYESKPHLDSQVARHYLNIDPTVKPVKQSQRRFRLEIMESIKT